MKHEELKQQLLDAAEKATPGEWCADYAYSAIRHVVRNCDIECGGTEGHKAENCPGAFGKYDGPYIALANPANIRSLIEGYEAKLAQARKEALEEAVNEACKFCAKGIPFLRDKHFYYGRDHTCTATLIRALIAKEPASPREEVAKETR